MRVLRWFGVSTVVLLGLLGAVAVGARFADGPLGPFPGGALSGQLATGQSPDWAGVGATVELQIRPERPWSLHTYAIPHRGELYVPSFFASQRCWVPLALADPRVVVRVGDRLYARRIERVSDPALRTELIAAMAKRHGYPPDGVIASDATWYFHLAPTATGGGDA
jgi:hypothetical protein